MKMTENTVLITGAGTGMGLAAAKAFARRGDRVLMIARNEARLRAEAGRVDGAEVFAADITDAGDLDRLTEWVAQVAPDLNVVFLNAGVTHTYQLFQTHEAAEYARQEMLTNFVSAVDLTHRFVPLLTQRPDAAIVITTSGVIYGPDTTNPTYSATKSALHSYIQSMRWALDRAKSSISVFELVAPLVDTPFSKDVKSDDKEKPEDVIAELLQSMASDTLEIRAGSTAMLYEEWRRDPDHAVALVNEKTGG